VRVLIVGGVLARDAEYRRSINPTPEMTLETGLRRPGVEVVVAPHSWRHSLAGIDIVHVHHLAKSVPGLTARRAVRPRPVVFTRHNEERTLPAKRAAALWLINRAADAVVALSHQEANRLRREVRGRIVVIRNGIDASACAREIRQEYAVETMIDRHLVLYLYQSLLQGSNSTAKRPARATDR
jgi:glycosyltransferase involved in cell wall biosynthesis